MPIPTPFKDDYSVDEVALKNMIDFHIKKGVGALIACGSTGEFAFLTHDERKKVVETVIDHANGRVPVVAGTHALTTNEAVALTTHAKGAGADAVLVVPTYYLKANETEIFGYYSEIAKVGLPIIVYNNPATTKIDLKPPLIARLAEEYDNIRYVKESSGFIQRVHEIMMLTEKITIFCGMDDLALESFAMGAKGWVSAGANLCMEKANLLFKKSALERRIDDARELYFALLPLFNLLEGSERYVQYVKAGLALLGYPVGPPRKPLLPLDSQDTQTLKNIMVKAKLLSPT